MKSTIGLVVAALALLAQSAFAQTPPANAALTTQDTFEIENLIARYAHGFDSGAQTGFMWADVFTPDGVFMDGSGREYRGRDAIAQFGSGGPNSRKTPTSIGHFITNIVIDATSSGASGGWITATFAPYPHSTVVIPRPIPVAPPVTINTRSFSIAQPLLKPGGFHHR